MMLSRIIKIAKSTAKQLNLIIGEKLARLKNGKNQYFCWTCKRPWANKNSNTECGNELCDYRINLNSILSSCELNEESDVNNQVKGAPKFRACP